MPLGPPIPGAPWNAARGSAGDFVAVDRSTTTAGTGKRRPFKRRVPRNNPEAERRLAGNTELDVDFFNSMVRQGIFVQEGPGQWSISGTVTGPTGPQGPAGPQGDPGSTTINDGSITYAKLQSETASTLLGRGSAGAGPPQELTVGSGLTLTGTTLAAAPGTVGGSATLKIKTADQSVTSSTTSAADNHLVFAIGANETWAVTYYLFVTGNATPDIRIALSTPTGCAGAFTSFGLVSTATTSGNLQTDGELITGGTTGDHGSATPGAGTVIGLTAWAGLINGANAGNVTFLWAQITSNGNATTLLKGSFLVAYRIA